MFSEDFETDFGLKQNGGVVREIVEILLEKYWVLDGFVAGLGGRK